MRVHTMQGAMSLQQADILEAYLNRTPGVTKATVYDRRFSFPEERKRETVTKYEFAETFLIPTFPAWV